MRVFIIGYMGSGKSTIGPKLAALLQVPYYDLDPIFEERYKIMISDFFLKYGELQFRKLEHGLLEEFARKDAFVISTGGGTPCHESNMELMKQSGVTVYLRATSGLLLSRLKKSPRKRPLLQNLSNEELEAWVREHLEQREYFYSQAEIVCDIPGSTPTEIAEKIRASLMPGSGG